MTRVPSYDLIRGMKSTDIKIDRAVRWVVKSYLQILHDGKSPALLASQIQANRWDLLARVNDRRLNQSSTLDRIESRARGEIRLALKADPAAALALKTHRDAEAARRDAEESAEIRDWKPFPLAAEAAPAAVRFKVVQILDEPDGSEFERSWWAPSKDGWSWAGNKAFRVHTWASRKAAEQNAVHAQKYSPYPVRVVETN